jgi:DNA anti-recombination protein RmuC
MAKHTWLILLALLAVSGCSDTKTVRKETHSDDRATIEETKVTHPDQEAFQKEMKQHLDDLDKEMTHWREKLAKAGAQAKEEMGVQLKNLEKQREVVAEQLRELSKSSGPAWGEMKEGFRKAFDELKEAAQKAREKFR